MTPVPSPEIEAITRRVLAAWATDIAVLENLVSHDEALRVLGFSDGEWWRGPGEVLEVRETQTVEIPDDVEFRVGEVEAFEEGSFGWAVAFSTVVTHEIRTELRHTGVFRLERGSWRVIQWHNSGSLANEAVFGFELTTTLVDLVASVLADENELIPSTSSEGTMSLVFTDVVDSTKYAETLGDSAWVKTIAAQEASIRQITAAQNGTVVKFLGDGSMLAFESARAAVRAAVEIQRCISQGPLTVRVGIHTGEVIRTADDVFGLTVNKAARLAAAAGPGGIMASSTTRDLVGSIPDVEMAEPQIVALKGLTGTHQIVPILWE
jgi:class 3 adenylate cyclase